MWEYNQAPNITFKVYLGLCHSTKKKKTFCRFFLPNSYRQLTSLWPKKNFSWPWVDSICSDLYTNLLSSYMPMKISCKTKEGVVIHLSSSLDVKCSPVEVFSLIHLSPFLLSFLVNFFKTEAASRFFGEKVAASAGSTYSKVWKSKQAKQTPCTCTVSALMHAQRAVDLRLEVSTSSQVWLWCSLF